MITHVIGVGTCNGSHKIRIGGDKVVAAARALPGIKIAVAGGCSLIGIYDSSQALQGVVLVFGLLVVGVGYGSQPEGILIIAVLGCQSDGCIRAGGNGINERA